MVNIGFLSDVKEYANLTTWAPEIYKESVGLSILSSITGNRVSMYISNRKISPNEYFLYVGVPSTGKGSVIEDICEDLISGKWGCGLDKIVFKPKVFTPEKLYERISKNPHTVSINDEMSTIISSARYMEHMAPTLTQLYNSRGGGRSTKTGGEHTFDESYLCLNWGIQPDVMENVVKSLQLGSGFLPRFIIVNGNPVSQKDVKNRIEMGKEWDNLRKELTDINNVLAFNEPILLTLHDDALKTFIKCVARLKRGAKSDVEINYRNRMNEHLLKLSILYWIDSNVNNIYNVEMSKVSEFERIGKYKDKNIDKNQDLTSVTLRDASTLLTISPEKYNMAVELDEQNIIKAYTYLSKIVPDAIKLLNVWAGSKDLKAYLRVEEKIRQILGESEAISKNNKIYVSRRDVARGTGILGNELTKILAEHTGDGGIVECLTTITNEKSGRRIKVIEINEYQLKKEYE